MRIRSNHLSDSFFYWLALKYGECRSSWDGLDEDFQRALLAEYVSITASFSR